MFEVVKEGLDQVIMNGGGDEVMKDPVHITAKGRPKTLQLRGITEGSKHSTKSPRRPQC